MRITTEAMYETAQDPDLSTYRSEKRLFMAVLIRALRDLVEGNQWDRESAIEWFSNTGSTLPHAISYEDVVDFVDLNAMFVHNINTVLNGRRVTIKNKHVRVTK